MAAGMNWWQALLTISLGNILVLIPMLLNAHAGTKYGVPFPVFVRASFGVSGANFAAMASALVACGWFGIQTWIGGLALDALITAVLGRLGEHYRTRLHSLPRVLGCAAGDHPYRHRGRQVVRVLLRAATHQPAAWLLIAWGSSWPPAASATFYATSAKLQQDNTPFWTLFWPSPWRRTWGTGSRSPSTSRTSPATP